MKVHYLWMQGIDYAPKSTRDQLTKHSQKWKDWGHDVFVWSDLDVQKLLQAGYKEHAQWYNSIMNTIQRCDVARAFVLHAYGGLYTDIDYEPFIDPKLDPMKLIVGTDSLMGANNAWIHSPAGHSFWLHHYIPHVRQQLFGPRLLDTLVSLFFPTWNIISSTGPQAYWTLKKFLVLDSKVYTIYGEHGKNSLPTWFNKYACSSQTILMLLIFCLALHGLKNLMFKN
jgi:mannosyltransferase OCH1-like enzyme